MKTLIAIFCLLFLSFSCFNSSNYVTLKIINKTDIEVDSLWIEINNYRARIPIAKPKVMSSISISRDSIKTYRDFHFTAYAIGKNSESFKEGFDYSDLSGTVYDDYYITLIDSNIVIMLTDLSVDSFPKRKW